MLLDEYKYVIPKESYGIMTKNVGDLRRIESKLREIFEKHNIVETIVPSFEYMELYKGVYEEFDENKIFKYIGREGKVIALRWDFTIPIARQFFLEKHINEAKYSYFGKIYRKTAKYKGRSSEEYQAGIEIVNKTVEDGDAECIQILEETIPIINLKNIKIELGSAELFNRICELTGDKEKLVEILSQKKISEMENFIKTRQYSENLKKLLLKLPRLTGDITMLEKTINELQDNDMIKILNQLKNTYKKMSMKENIIFDLSMCPSMEYYTGIMFKVYTPASPEAIIIGGRYDSLYRNFGKDVPAIGMGYYLNNILKAMEKNNER